MHNRIMYAIDRTTGLVISRVGDEYAWPILDFAGMKPENNFKTTYKLEKIPVAQCSIYAWDLIHTRKIPLAIRNKHRAFWGLRPVRPSPKYCPDCGEHWRKCKCRPYDYIECGCCGSFHPYGWDGDCRDDEHRFHFDQLKPETRIYWLEDQREEDTNDQEKEKP